MPEDARIERMIKAKFPGLRRDFAAAYKSLHDRDLFEISGKDVSSLALIDRLNLQFKLGLHCQVPIPFSADEQQYVTRMEETTTFEEVVELARELYEMQKEEDEKNQPEQEPEQDQDSPESGAGEGSGGDGENAADSDESGEGGSGADDTDESGDESGSGGEGDESLSCPFRTAISDTVMCSPHSSICVLIPSPTSFQPGQTPPCSQSRWASDQYEMVGAMPALTTWCSCFA